MRRFQTVEQQQIATDGVRAKVSGRALDGFYFETVQWLPVEKARSIAQRHPGSEIQVLVQEYRRGRWLFLRSEKREVRSENDAR